ncbi:MAG: hypothetical protein ACI4EK_08535 [Wujia sp.]
MKDLRETEKNFLSCGCVISVVGVLLMLMGQSVIGKLSVMAGVIFLGIAVRMILVRKRSEHGAQNNDDGK